MIPISAYQTLESVNLSGNLLKDAKGLFGHTNMRTCNVADNLLVSVNELLESSFVIAHLSLFYAHGDYHT